VSTRFQNPTVSTISIVSGLRRPTWICSGAKQVCILARDASGSMTGEKARDAEDASRDLVTELASPDNKDGFRCAVVDFSSDAQTGQTIEDASTLSGHMPSLSVSGDTNITSALERAVNLLDEAERASGQTVTYLRPVVILFSDGCHNTGPDPRDVGNSLKQKADLVTVAFGTDADESMLLDLATSPQHFYRCRNGRDLRQFLAAVGKTMTRTLAAKTNATLALAQIRDW